MSSRRTWIALFAATAGSIGFLWLPCGSSEDVSCIPLGVPGEWIWNRIPVDDGEVALLLLGWLLAAVAFLAYGTVIWLGTHRINRCSRGESIAWLAGLVVVGFFWLSVLQESPPEGYRTSKAVRVLYYEGSSGYFTVARDDISNVPSFLSGYEARMSAGDVLHVGTHPPGLFLFHRGLINLCDRYPSLVKLTVASQPESVTAALSLIASQTPLLVQDRAALWMAALITQAVGVLAIVPLYLLLRRTFSRPVSWLAASLWPLVPGLAVFLPKSDALYPLIGLMFLYCWLEGCRRRSFVLCAVAGLLFWLGMFLSLALLPVGVLGLLLCVWEARFAEGADAVPNRWKSLCNSTVWAAVPFLAATAILWAVYNINLFNVWRWNVINHAAFYDNFPRTHWKWLLVNPWELALATGLPIIFLAIAGARRSIQLAIHSQASGQWRQLGPCCCCLLTLGLLWLSGKNSGEAARLWLFLIPWLIWLSADGFNDSRPVNSEDTSTLSMKPRLADVG